MKSPSSALPCAPEYQHPGLLRRARRERIRLGSLTKVRVREKAHYGVEEAKLTASDGAVDDFFGLPIIPEHRTT